MNAAFAASTGAADESLGARVAALRNRVEAHEVQSRFIRAKAADTATLRRFATGAAGEARRAFRSASAHRASSATLTPGWASPWTIERSLASLQSSLTRSQRLLKDSRDAVEQAKALVWGNFDARLPLVSGHEPLAGGGPDPQEDVLVRSLRTRILAGVLPRVDGRVMARTGTGQPCIVCSEPIGERQVEYEVQDDRQTCAHQRCYMLWLLESK